MTFKIFLLTKSECVWGSRLVMHSTPLLSIVSHELNSYSQNNLINSWVWTFLSVCITCLSAGDHVICGSYDCKLSWFDLDLSTKPYKMLRYVTASSDVPLSFPFRREIRDSSHGGCFNLVWWLQILQLIIPEYTETHTNGGGVGVDEASVISYNVRSLNTLLHQCCVRAKDRWAGMNES